MADGRILGCLKDGTAAQHEALERRVDLANRLRDPATYAGLLGRFYGFYAPLEAALGRVGGYESVGLDFAERRKAALLRRDLIALGRDPDGFPLRPTPAVGSLASALGTLYVLEGATLGGRFITATVAARLGLTPDRGCGFFASYGARVGAMWAAFRAALVAYATGEEVETEVVAAANDTFDALDRWLAAAEGPS
jgi:heme oxygenase